MLELRTKDLELAKHTIAQIYCPHELRLHPTSRNIECSLKLIGSSKLPVAHLGYNSRLTVDAGHFPKLFLLMKCINGSGKMQQGSRTSNLTLGKTLPLSANIGTKLNFDDGFLQSSLQLDFDRLQELCSRYLGYALDQDLQFELSTFHPKLEQTWALTLPLLEKLSDDSGGFPTAALAGLQEYVLNLVLQWHPHNYSDALSKPDRSYQPRLLRQAEQFMHAHAGEPITVSDISAELGVSVRALQARFQQAHSMTPGAYLRNIRLHKVRQVLLDADQETKVTDIALQFGFFHLGRFSQYYKQLFGEGPNDTLVRSRKWTGAGRSRSSGHSPKPVK